MRPDFNKVLTERPRRRHKNKHKDIRKSFQSTFDVDSEYDEDGPIGGRQGMRRPYQAWDTRKDNSDLWSAIRRFMASRVGRRWDDVWSECNRDLHESDDMRAHWRVHCKIEVDEKLEIADNGRLWRPRGNMSRTESRVIDWTVYDADEIPGCRKRFYVDPRDGILRKTPQRARVYWLTPEWKAKEEERRGRENGWIMSDGVHIQFIDDIWYSITLIPYQGTESYNVPIFDGGRYRYELRYRIVTQYRREKRQLNSREMKKYGVRNA